MSFDSDAGFVPDATGFAIFFLLKQRGGDPVESGWVRLWSGSGDFALPADATDTSGGIYKGLGFPTAMEGLSGLINGDFDTLNFSLSGVDATALSMAGSDRADVDGALVHIGMIDLDGAAQAVGTTDWLWEGCAGRPRTQRIGLGEGATMSVVLPVTTSFFDRNLASQSWWSAKSQRLRDAADKFFDGMSSMTSWLVLPWPN